MTKKLRTKCILSGKNINIHSYNIQMDSLPFIFFQPVEMLDAVPHNVQVEISKQLEDMQRSCML